MTALVGIPIMLLAVQRGGAPFFILSAVLFAGLLHEWLRIAKAARVVGAIGIAVGVAAFVFLRSQPDGARLLTWLLAVVWTRDSVPCLLAASPLHGLIGRYPIWPSISPRKTWDGMFSGAIGAVLLSAPLGARYAAAGFVLAWIGGIGDLLASAAKRRAGLRHSGSVFPGHGGWLDRFDSFLAIMIAAAGWVLIAH